MFEESLRSFDQATNAYKLQSALDELFHVRFRLGQLENAHLAAKEERQRQVHLQQQGRMNALQEAIRDGRVTRRNWS